MDARCYCGMKVVLLESSTVTNPGISFIRCLRWEGQDCKYFTRVDEIEGGWEALARSVIGINNKSDFVNIMTITELSEESNLKVV
ncbi:hypothetical protein AHAS_Ahas09G0052900 [Arachis hypogaea]